MKKRNKIFIFFSSILLMLLLAFSISIKTKADTYKEVDYEGYNYIVNVVDTNYQDDFVVFNIIASISNNIITYQNNSFDNIGYAWKSDMDINQLGVYLVHATTGEPQLGFAYYYFANVDLITSYDLYITRANYQDGYNEGISNQYSYGEGYQEGYNMGNQEGYDTGYTEGLGSGYDLGYDTGYNVGINTQVPNQQLSIMNLLGLIFMYPFKLIGLGMDIELFGVNIGALILTLLVVGFVLGIIGIVRRKSS